jgi:hypothetical protein
MRQNRQFTVSCVLVMSCTALGPFTRCMVFVPRCVVRHHATQLGLILTLVAWCSTTRRGTQVMFCVNRPSILTRHSELARYLVANLPTSRHNHTYDEKHPTLDDVVVLTNLALKLRV